jgi:hypothetical protein
LNCNRAAYLNLISEGDFNIAAAPAPETPQAPSQYTYHDMSMIVPSVYLDGSIDSAMKSAKTCDFMALLSSKSITCSDSSMTHVPILPDESRFLKMLFNGWVVRTLTLWASK